jgi:hypothetical protein
MADNRPTIMADNRPTIMADNRPTIMADNRPTIMWLLKTKTPIYTIFKNQTHE